jgi:hypothetical protein
MYCILSCFLSSRTQHKALCTALVLPHAGKACHIKKRAGVTRELRWSGSCLLRGAESGCNPSVSPGLCQQCGGQCCIRCGTCLGPAAPAWDLQHLPGTCSSCLGPAAAAWDLRQLPGTCGSDLGDGSICLPASGAGAHHWASLLSPFNSLHSQGRGGPCADGSRRGLAWALHSSPGPLHCGPLHCGPLHCGPLHCGPSGTLERSCMQHRGHSAAATGRLQPRFSRARQWWSGRPSGAKLG